MSPSTKISSYMLEPETNGDLQVMMIVNLVGYGMGQAGVNDLLRRMSESWTTGIGLLFSFFCATHLMFEVRRREKEQMM